MGALRANISREFRRRRCEWFHGADMAWTSIFLTFRCRRCERLWLAKDIYQMKKWDYTNFLHTLVGLLDTR